MTRAELAERIYEIIRYHSSAQASADAVAKAMWPLLTRKARRS